MGNCFFFYIQRINSMLIVNKYKYLLVIK